jgi:rhodanese-related sulfurtransferase
MFLPFFGTRRDTHARTLVAHGARLVDVRSALEFADRHLPNALNIPVQQLSERMVELGSKERPLVVYCRSGARSAEATRLLRSAGFVSVYDMGGMSNWGEPV